MSLQYNIWGISDGGYNISISKSSSLTESTLTALKESFRDNHRTIAEGFASANPMQDNFYSIEKRANKILYTIYRTNWYRGARLSYDAATIISSSRGIESPISALKSLMNAYVGMKDKGLKSINLDHILSLVKINQTEVPVRSVLKSGYIKYNTESDLLEVFKNHSDTVKNFNKVYFFTKLPYFETGAGKIQNLNDYKQISVSIINFDSTYHRVIVNGVNKNLRTTQRQTFNCFPGDEIKVFNGNTQVANSTDIATSATEITLDAPPKRETNNTAGSSSQNNKNKKNKKNKEKYLVIGLCSLLVLLILGFVYVEDIVDVFNGKSMTYHNNDDNKDRKNNNTCKIELVDGHFTGKDEKEITDPSELLECFKDGHIKIDDIKYKLTDLTIQNWKHKKWMDIKSIEELNSLKKKLQEKDKDSVSKQVVNEIEKRINLLKLESESGLKGKNYTWKWKVKDKKPVLLLLHKDSTDFIEAKGFIQNTDNVKHLLDFLKTTIPTSVLEDIKEYIKENGSEEVIQYLKTLEKEEKKEAKEKDDSIEDANLNKENLEEKKKTDKKVVKEEKKKKKKEEKKKKKEEKKKKKEEKKKKKEEKKECTVDHEQNTATLVRLEMKSRNTLQDESDGKITLTQEQIEEETKNLDSICDQIQAIKGIFKNCTCDKKIGKLTPFINSKCN